MPALIIALSLLLLTTPLYAQETHYDRISLSVESSEEVDNDTLVAVLYAQQEGTDAELIAGEVNRLIGDAVKQAKQVAGVKVQTLDYSTQPVYGKGTFNGAPKLAGWRVRQSLRLESRDSAALSSLVGDLQQSLALNSIGYSVSPELRREAEERLIGSAIRQFRERADLISREMQRGGYRLVEMAINTSGYMPRPYQVRGMAMEAKIADAPTLEGGTQRVQVSINGSIELDAATE